MRASEVAAGPGPVAWSRRLTALVAVLLLGAPLGGAAPALAGSAEQHQQRAQEAEQEAERAERELEEVRREIEEAVEDLEEIEEEQQVAIEDIDRLDAEIAELDERLAALQDDLAEAEGDLEAAEERLATTEAELERSEEELAETRDELAEEQDRFASRTRASFMQAGELGVLDELLNAADGADLARSLHYATVVLDDDQERVERLETLQRRVEEQTERLGELEREHAEQRVAAEVERDRVADLVAEEEELRAEVEAERERREQALAELEEDEDQYEALVASLESDSESIESELAELAEEQEEAERAAAEAGSSEGTDGGGSGQGSVSDDGAQLQRPSSGRVTSPFGYRTHPIHGGQRMHEGVDYAAGYGSEVVAAESGRVISAGNRGGYGQTVLIDHGSGMTTLYAHLSRFAVSSGEQVQRGQVVGYEGATGAVTGPHLHFEVRINGEPRDPKHYR